MKIFFEENSEYEVVGIFSDVKTGLRVNGRSGYAKLKEIIENDQIDILFCKSLSRISRDSLELIQFIRLLIDKEILLNEGGRFV